MSVLRSLITAYFNVKMFLKICSLEKSFITIPKVVLGLQKKVVQQRISCMEGQQGVDLQHNIMKINLIS